MQKRAILKQAILNTDISVRVGETSVFKGLPVQLKSGQPVEILEVRSELTSDRAAFAKARVRLTKNFLADCFLPLAVLDFVEDQVERLPRNDSALK